MSDYNGLTKQQLIDLLLDADQTIEDQKVEIEEKTTRLGELKAHGQGWLIQTPNPAYEGRTMGIQFVQGQAFIRKDQRVPFCEVKPMKDTTIAKLGYTAEQAKAIREREQATEAERAVRLLENDFHYTVVEFDGTEADDKKMEALMNKRALEYQQALEAAEAARKASEIVAPGYMN